MSITAVFAGSFCPFTKGHEDILQKAMPLFDKIVIGVGHNYKKKDLFSPEQRVHWIRQIYHDNFKIEVESFHGLTVDFCQQVGAQFLIRGVRNASDYMAEEEIRLVNQMLNDNIETIYLPASPQWAAVSSSLVRELWSLNADYTPYLSYTLPPCSQ